VYTFHGAADMLKTIINEYNISTRQIFENERVRCCIVRKIRQIEDNARKRKTIERLVDDIDEEEEESTRETQLEDEVCELLDIRDRLQHTMKKT
jgi:hypothetical protein